MRLSDIFASSELFRKHIGLPRIVETRPEWLDTAGVPFDERCMQLFLVRPSDTVLIGDWTTPEGALALLYPIAHALRLCSSVETAQLVRDYAAAIRRLGAWDGNETALGKVPESLADAKTLHFEALTGYGVCLITNEAEVFVPPEDDDPGGTYTTNVLTAVNLSPVLGQIYALARQNRITPEHLAVPLAEIWDDVPAYRTKKENFGND